MNEPNKLERFSLASLSSLEWSNTLVAWANSQVTKKMKCCKYAPRGGSTVVDQSTTDHEIEGSNPAPACEQEKMEEKVHISKAYR
jgi:hypothetical protein